MHVLSGSLLAPSIDGRVGLQLHRNSKASAWDLSTPLDLAELVIEESSWSCCPMKAMKQGVDCAWEADCGTVIGGCTRLISGLAPQG